MREVGDDAVLSHSDAEDAGRTYVHGRRYRRTHHGVTHHLNRDRARSYFPRHLEVDLTGTAKRLHQLFASKPGETDVRLRLLRSKEFLVSYDVPDRVRADREFRHSVEEICGAGSVEIMPG